MKMSMAARAFYGRVFTESLIDAAGEETVDFISETFIDPAIEHIVKRAGIDAGLELREIHLKSRG
jgi:hypothetical protein